MAASTAYIEEHITCCVCFHTYRDPQALICLHTLCKPCVDRLTRRGAVECPECRQVTRVPFIRKDFKTQTLIDSHNQQLAGKCVESNKLVDLDEETSKTVQHNCGMCSDGNNSAASYCEECEDYMCCRCERTHSGMKVCKSHTVVPITELVKAGQDQLKNVVAVLQDEQRIIKASSIEAADIVNKIEDQQRVQFGEVDERIDEIIGSLERRRTELYSEIRGANSNVVADFRNSMEQCDKHLDKIQDKIDRISATIEKGDMKEINDMCMSVEQSRGENIALIKGILSSVRDDVSSPVKVVKSDWQLKVGIGVEIVDKSSAAYSGLRSGTYKQEIWHEVGSNAQRLVMIKNNLWCAGYQHGIQVYNQNCELIKDICNRNIRYVTGIALWENGDVIIACSDLKGLHQIAPNGTYIRPISQAIESFTDVIVNSNKVYALNSSSNKIDIFKRNENKWSKTDCIPLQKVEFSDKFALAKGLIYLSSWIGNAIQIYNMEGQLLQTYGRRGDFGLGELKRPVICGIDSMGSALICDQNNNRFQILNRDGSWKVVVGLAGDMKTPFDAVVSEGGGCMWVVTHSKTNTVPPQIIKYTKL